MNRRKISRKRYIEIVLVVSTILILFLGRNKIVSSYKYIDNVIQVINFKLVNVKSSVYKKVLIFNSKVRDISYIDKYIENNKEKDFEFQKSKLQNIELKNIRRENEQLRTMLQMREKNQSEYIAAGVSLVEGLETSNRLFIDKGKKQGIIDNLPVIYNGYLIGKITKVGEEYSEVTLLTNKKSKISIVINDGNMAILRGNGNGTFSIFNYNENVSENYIMKIDTSGISDVFPRGLNIGSFTLKSLNNFKQTREINLKPIYNVYDIQNVLVYKWDSNSNVNKEIQEQINMEIQEELQKNKGTTQVN